MNINYKRRLHLNRVKQNKKETSCNGSMVYLISETKDKKSARAQKKSKIKLKNKKVEKKGRKEANAAGCLFGLQRHIARRPTWRVMQNLDRCVLRGAPCRL